MTCASTTRRRSVRSSTTVLLVIFGAGASYDSDSEDIRSNHLERPPLARDLFDPRRPIFAAAIDRFRECRPIITQVTAAAARGEMIESTLRELQAQEDSYEERAVHLAAVRMYLQEVLWKCPERWLEITHGLTNYVLLVDRLARWQRQTQERIAFVTFNYDTLLEQALSDVLFVTWDSMAAYVERDDFAVFKPHGSVNWAHRVPWDHPHGNPDWYRRQMCSLVRELEIPPDFKVVHSLDDVVERHQTDRWAHFPAIAIPVDRKNEFECPPEHLDALEEALALASRVIVVGWRATEAHFLALYTTRKDEPRPLLVVAEDRAAADATWISLRDAGVNRIGTSGTYNGPWLGRSGMYGLVHGADDDVLERFLQK